ncbi:MAG: transposase, partial [Firmicutes bacterium]|nr:transposase [Bacillota bacterium]
EYLNIIKRYKKKYNFKLYAYCIMDNHAHLLIEVDKVPLSKIMQGIQQVYTQNYNKDYKRTGHVFEQRYKAIICDKDSYLLNLIRYIHMNPVQAGMAKGLKYKWSSHNQYLKEKSDLIEYQFPLSLFSNNKKQRRKLYIAFMTEKEIDELENYSLSKEEIKKHVKDDDEEKTIQIDLDVIINKTIDYLDLSKEMLKSRGRNRKISTARRVIILLARNHTEAAGVSISEAIGVTKSLVSKINNDLLKTDDGVYKIYNEIISEIKSTFQP